MRFEIVGPLRDIEVIAAGRSVRQRRQLRRRYGGLRWRKLKGVGTVRLGDGSLGRAEIHWYEAHGIGKVRYKIRGSWREDGAQEALRDLHRQPSRR